MRRWTEDVIRKEDLEQVGLANRRQLLKWCAAGSGAALTGLAGCTGSQEKPDTAGNQNTAENRDSVENQSNNQGRSGSIKFQLPNDAQNLDPTMWQNTDSAVVVGNMYDKLAMYNQDMELVPRAAESMPEVSDDLLTYDWKLREGVLFHGGDKEMTAEDVVYSIDFLANPPGGDGAVVNASSFYEPWIDTVERLSKYEVRMNLKQPFGLLPIWLTRAGDIVRKGAHGEVQEAVERETGNVTELTDGAKVEDEASIGPFYLTEWASGDHITLEAHDDYWMDGAPKVNEVTFQVIPEGSTAISALRSGAVDILWQFPLKNYDSLKNRPDTEAGSVPGLKAEAIYFDNQFGFEDAPDDAQAWEHLRKAVAYGIDRRAVVKQIFRGQARPSWAPWVNGLGGDWTVKPELRYENQDWVDDPERREELVMNHLEQGGRPDGFQFDAVATSSSWFVNMAQVMAGQLEQYGINMNVIPTEKAQMSSYYYGGMEGGYDAAVEDFDNSFPAPEWWLLEGYYDVPNHIKWRNADQIEGEAPRTGNDTNTPWYDEFGEAVMGAMQTNDQETRKQNVWKAQQMAVDHMGQVNICFVNIAKAWRNQVSGYGPSQIGYWDDLRKTSVSN